MPSVLYPPISPFAHGMMAVGDGHHVYWETSGNPDGMPVIFLHGGPGAGCTAEHRRLFDPEHYKIVLFDQRGCGRSTPHAEIEANTTWHLVSDIEQLREHLKIENWLVFGGSWGSALALAYAQTHPTAVSGLILRGVFTLRQSELKWYYQEGASWVFPEYWEDFIAPIPLEERDNLIQAYRRRLTIPDRDAQVAAAKTWSVWEGRTITLMPNSSFSSNYADDGFALAFARIENHYFVNNGFFDDDQLIRNAHRLSGIPGVIVQGRYDMATPVRTAWELSRQWNEGELRIIEDAGHAVTESSITAALIEATDRFRFNQHQ